jgi:hypothetical protein
MSFHTGMRLIRRQSRSSPRNPDYSESDVINHKKRDAERTRPAIAFAVHLDFFALTVVKISYALRSGFTVEKNHRLNFINNQTLFLLFLYFKDDNKKLID